MEINPVWLETFRAVCAVGSFTRAADKLDLTQAAVSQHIKHIEQIVGPVFLRHGRKISLMPAGHALVEYASELQAAGRRLDLRLASDGALAGAVRVATPGSVGMRICGGLLDLQAQNRDICVHHRFAPTDDIMRDVLDDRAELGIITRIPDDPRLQFQKIGLEPVELIVPVGTVINGYDDLCQLGFIDHPDGQAMATRLLGQRFKEFTGIKAIPCHGFSNQISLILEPVARGLGFTVLPRFARQAFHRPDKIAVVDLNPVVFDALYAIYRAEWPLSGLANHVLNTISTMVFDPTVPSGRPSGDE